MFWGFFFVAWGLMGFFSGIFHINLGSLFFPILIIAIGISILFKSPQKIANYAGGSSDQNKINESIVFGSLEKTYTSSDFSGGKIDCVFAGMKVDLRNIKLSAKGADLEINAIFGGGEVLVSKDMCVQAQGTGVFGGWENSFSAASSTNTPVLRIKGAAVFGGVEVKNQ